MNTSYAADDIETVIFTEEQIKARVRELGEELTEMYKGKIPVFVCVLNGSSLFFADLIKCYNGDMRIEFISVSSYEDNVKSKGSIDFRKDFDRDITGKDLIIVEDIVDSGLTLKCLRESLLDRNAKSVLTVSLLDKYDCHDEGLSCDIIGFPVENKFVVGYGLDYAQKYRNLPYIGVLKEEVYKH